MLFAAALSFSHVERATAAARSRWNGPGTPSARFVKGEETFFAVSSSACAFSALFFCSIASLVVYRFSRNLLRLICWEPLLAFMVSSLKTCSVRTHNSGFAQKELKESYSE